MGKKCCVPHCHSGYRKYNEKHPMYGVPKDDFFLTKWQKVIARADRPITPNDSVCQKHFLPDDFFYSRIVKGELEKYKVPKLKPDAIPSIFPDLPDCIHGTVKKRREFSVDDEQYRLQKMKKEHEVCDKTTNDKDDNTTEQENSKITPCIENEISAIIKVEDIKQEDTSCDDNYSSHSNVIVLCDTVIKDEINIKSEDTFLVEEETGPKIYKCNQCSYSTKWPNNLQTHQIKHLEGEQYYFRCELCPKFKSKWHSTYKSHMKLKHSLGPQEFYNCTLCQFKTKIKVSLKRHLKRHEQGRFDNNVFCVICNFKCSSEELLKLHLESNHPSKKLQCRECLFQTDFKRKLTRHVNSVHKSGDPSGVSSSLLIPKIVKKSAKVIKTVKSIEKFQKCTKCNFSTNSETSLIKHILQHNYNNLLSCVAENDSEVGNSSENFCCSDCEFKCNSKPEYLTHTLMHRNISIEKLN